MDKFYVTTPIYYVNDVPHIGHAYTTIAADALARYHRNRGAKVLFATGVDENSQKTVIAAAAAKTQPARYATAMAATWQKTWDSLDIKYDDFIRTTSKRHKEAVAAFFAKIKKADVYKGTYEGLYCVGHEAFLKPDELVDGKCPDHGTVPQKVKEENYFFKLSNYQKPLLEYIKAHPEFIQPEHRRNEIVAFIQGGVEDFSISRQKTGWGIPYPDDPKQVLYVWFDALINYLTVAGFPNENYTQWWPAELHLMAKDIIRFHCVYWPAMLMSAGLPLPKAIFAHGFFTIDGQKISKTLGNTINPLEISKQYGIDALRYYLLREIPFGSDGDFNHARFESVYESELANDLGNLVQRVASMVGGYMKGNVGQVPPFAHDDGPFHQAMGQFRLDKALGEIRDVIRGLNQYIDEEKPWQLVKTDPAQLQVVLTHAVSDLVQLADWIEPFMPQTAEKMMKIFEGPEINLRVGMLFPKKEQQFKKKEF